MREAHQKIQARVTEEGLETELAEFCGTQFVPKLYARLETMFNEYRPAISNELAGNALESLGCKTARRLKNGQYECSWFKTFAAILDGSEAMERPSDSPLQDAFTRATG